MRVSRVHKSCRFANIAWQSSSAPSASTTTMTSNGPGKDRTKAASSISPTKNVRPGCAWRACAIMPALKSTPTPNDGLSAARRSPVPHPSSSTRAPSGMRNFRYRRSSSWKKAARASHFRRSGALASARRRMSRLRADMSPSPPYVLASIPTRIRDSVSICPNYGSGADCGPAPCHGQGPMPAYYRPTNENTRSGEDAMSRTLRTALFVAAIAAVSALAPSARAQEAVTLHGAVQFNDDHAFNKALLRFEQLVKQYYGKPINFVLHRNSELGLEKDYFAYMNQGISVDYGIVSPAHMSTFSKAAPFIDAPFLFRDLDHWNKVLDADLLKPIADEIAQKADVMLIGYAGGGVR